MGTAVGKILARRMQRLWCRVPAGVMLLVMLFAYGPAAFALEFVPLESEWLAWPAYCQARYMESAAGRKSKFAGRVHPAVVDDWRKRLGSAWSGLHHYCAGLAINNQARLEPNARNREHKLKRVLSENAFFLERAPREHPLHAEAQVRTALVFRDLGQREEASNHLQQAVSGCPQCPIGYQGQAMYFRDEGRLAEARDALESGNAALEGRSAEIHYALGLVLIELGEISKARDHASQAYELGAPLPGLRERLAELGHPLN